MPEYEVVKALDEADLFLRDRANAAPAPLNEYDVEILLGIAKTCDEAANFINRLMAEAKEKGDLLYHQGRIIRMLELAGTEKLAELDKYREVVGVLDVKNGEAVAVLDGKETKYINKNVAETFKRMAVKTARTNALKEVSEAFRRKGRVYEVGGPSEPKRVVGFEETEFEELLQSVFDGHDLCEFVSGEG